MSLKASLLLMSFTVLLNCKIHAQSDAFPNIISHMDCSGLLSGPYEVKTSDIKDSIFLNGFNLKLIVYGGRVSDGIANQMSEILMTKGDYIMIRDNKDVYKGFKYHMESVLKNLDKDFSKYRDQLLITTFNSEGIDVVTYFHFTSNNRIVAYSHPIVQKGDTKACHQNLEAARSILKAELGDAVKNDHSVIWYGDAKFLDVNEVAKGTNALVFRRPQDIDRIFPKKVDLFNTYFDPSSSAVCNAVPSTKKQLQAGGFNSEDLPTWRAYKNEIADLVVQHFQSHLETVAELKEELLNGDKDILLIVAHLKGADLFIGDDMITLEELKAWGKRTKPLGKNRTAVLCICNSGNQAYTVGSLFWKRKVVPLSSILLENAYFTTVISPDHTIFQKETTSVISNLLSRKSLFEIKTAFDGWEPYVFVGGLRH